MWIGRMFYWNKAVTRMQVELPALAAAGNFAL
jgi:hypothetical protein